MLWDVNIHCYNIFRLKQELRNGMPSKWLKVRYTIKETGGPMTFLIMKAMNYHGKLAWNYKKHWPNSAAIYRHPICSTDLGHPLIQQNLYCGPIQKHIKLKCLFV